MAPSHLPHELYAWYLWQLFFSAYFLGVSGCVNMVWDEERSFRNGTVVKMYAVCLLWDLLIYTYLFCRSCFRDWVTSFYSFAKFIAPWCKVQEGSEDISVTWLKLKNPSKRFWECASLAREMVLSSRFVNILKQSCSSLMLW